MFFPLAVALPHIMFLLSTLVHCFQSHFYKCLFFLPLALSPAQVSVASPEGVLRALGGKMPPSPYPSDFSKATVCPTKKLLPLTGAVAQSLSRCWLTQANRGLMHITG